MPTTVPATEVLNLTPSSKGVPSFQAWCTLDGAALVLNRLSVRIAAGVGVLEAVKEGSNAIPQKTSVHGTFSMGLGRRLWRSS